MKTPIEKAAEEVVMKLPNHLGVDEKDVQFIAAIIHRNLKDAVPEARVEDADSLDVMKGYNQCRRDIGLEDL